ncbi:MAG: hypothetical protein DWQ08_00325 [Proteobacteria bacterium]|nr:MAG: hypothetical protein DWQ08_00325 [Pseudomonadota bacterium]
MPVLPWSRILHWLDTGVEFDPHEAIQWLPFLVRKGGPLSFGLPVEDDAMCSEDPYSYPPESMIFVDPDQALQVKRTDRVLALLSDRETLCFRQLGRRGSQRVLEAMNPAHPVITGPFRVVGKVVARLVSDT